MKMQMLVGKDSEVDLVIERNSMTGGLSYSENGEKHTLMSALNIFAHFNVTFNKEYSFTVGSDGQYAVILEHIRPAMFGGLRAHTYKVQVDGELIKEFTGF